jgi:single-strand DNA-binding protein
MSKGRPILVEGRLRYRQWTNKEGQNRSKVDVFVENFTFLGSGGGRNQSGGPRGQGAGGPGGGPSPVDDMPPPEDPDIPF